MVSSLTWPALALMAGSHVLAQLGEGGEVLGAVPAADWKHGRVTLAASGVHLLLCNGIGGVRDVVLVVDLEHFDWRLRHLLVLGWR